MAAAVASATDIADMPDPRARFAHVIKHLYSTRERWDLAIHELPPELRAQAIKNGCDARNLVRKEPSWFDACEPCRKYVLADHDQFYQPAYRTALVTASQAGRHGRSGAGMSEFVGDNGVYVIVGHNRTRGLHVSTAYRVEPRGIRAERATADDFFLAAERKLRDKTSYGEEA